jgi:catechol 2,3-dioxygenase
LFALHYRHYPTDHVVSKTTYLDDPEGQNIELYIPSPEDGTYTVRNGVYDFAPSSPSQFEHRESMLVCCSSTNHPDKQKENRQEDKRLAPRLIKRSDQENKRFFVRLIVENKQEGSHISA